MILEGGARLQSLVKQDVVFSVGPELGVEDFLPNGDEELQTPFVNEKKVDNAINHTRDKESGSLHQGLNNNLGKAVVSHIKRLGFLQDEEHALKLFPSRIFKQARADVHIEVDLLFMMQIKHFCQAVDVAMDPVLQVLETFEDEELEGIPELNWVDAEIKLEQLFQHFPLPQS